MCVNVGIRRGEFDVIYVSGHYVDSGCGKPTGIQGNGCGWDSGT